MTYNPKQWSVGKWVAAAIILLMSLFMASHSCLFSRMRMPMRNLAMRLITRIRKLRNIIGEFRDSDSTGATDRVSIHINRRQSRTKGLLRFLRIQIRLEFHIQMKKDGRRFLAPTLAYDTGKKGLHIKITI